jgi:hypothetical protein
LVWTIFLAGTEHPAKLHLRSTIAPGGLDVVDAQLDGAMDAGFEVRLTIGRDFLRINVLPFVLVPHAAARDDGHWQLSPTEAAVFHARER